MSRVRYSQTANAVSVKRAIKASGIKPTPAQVLAVLARVGVVAGWGRDDGSKQP